MPLCVCVCVSVPVIVVRANQLSVCEAVCKVWNADCAVISFTWKIYDLFVFEWHFLNPSPAFASRTNRKIQPIFLRLHRTLIYCNFACDKALALVGSIDVQFRFINMCRWKVDVRPLSHRSSVALLYPYDYVYLCLHFDSIQSA